jgi:uncharacterized membrane protein YphA (DoxX/SURF4 family)
MPKVTVGARLVLGLIFAVFGLNFFVGFLPAPELSPRAGAFFQALIDSGYLFAVEKVVELAAGILLLAGWFVPLALVLLAPIVLNILMFHLFLDPANLPLALVVTVLEVFLAWRYRHAFEPLLEARTAAQPGEASA